MTAAIAGTVGQALSAAADALRAAGVDSPRLDAELLLAEATGRGRAALAASPEAGVPADAAREFGAMIRRRAAREPLAYILGRKGFRRIELRVDPRVLIPRPETELLVEVANELAPRRVVDVGTGSGAVAMAIADENPTADVVATDISLDALAVAEANRARLAVAVRLQYGSLPQGGQYELLVANLPYVSEAEWHGLAPEITRYEPREALVCGPTGLEAIAALLGELALIPQRPASIALEVGAGQAPTVGELVRRAGWEKVEARRDLAGIERVVCGH